MNLATYLHIVPRLSMRGVVPPPYHTSTLNKEFLTLVISLFLTSVRYRGKLLNCSSCFVFDLALNKVTQRSLLL